MRVICVDDAAVILEHTVKLCEGMPQIDDVRGFTNPLEALDYVKENPVDLALLDIEMPEMNGDGLTFKGASVEGRNFICAFTVDESLLGGKPMKQAFSEAGMNEESFAQTMRELMFEDMTAEDKAIFQSLKVYKYNLVYRLIGSSSGDQMDCVIRYQDLPK